MSAKRRRTRSAKPTREPSGVERLGQVFIEQIRSRGRIHHRALLAAMRECLEHPATERTQELAMMLRGKLRLWPQKVKDIEDVRRTLAGESGSGEASG